MEVAIQPLAVAEQVVTQVRTSTGPQTPVEEGEIVVTGRRLPKTLEGARPTDDFDEGRISTYGARSIDELLERLKQQFGGRDFSIVLNGRRLGSIADIGALPPEALQSLQVFSGAEGKRFGFSANAPLVNLTLKRNFRTLALDSDFGGSTDGGNRTSANTLRGVNIANDNRVNATLGVRAESGLISSQRPWQPGVPLPPGQSLVPESRSFAATFGTSRPLGAGTLDIGARLGGSRANRQSGPVGAQQSTMLENGGLTATYSKNLLGFFWTLFSDIGVANTRFRVKGASGDIDACNTCRIGTNDTSRSSNGSLILNASGGIVRLPAGDLRLDTSATKSRSVTTLSSDPRSGRSRTRYATTSAEANLSIPLIGADSGWLRALGRVDIAPSISYAEADDRGGITGRNVSVLWAPFPSLMINASLSDQPQLPSGSQIADPVQILPGATAFDYRVGSIVPIEQILGGAPLLPQRSIDRRLSVDYNGSAYGTRIAASIGYTSRSVRQPTISLAEPSPLLEQLFPERFLRDTDGTLRRVDTRPFNAESDVGTALSMSINLWGTIGATPTRQNPASNANWNFSLRGDRQLRQSLILTKGADAIDTLRNPLSLSTGVTGRQRWSSQAGIQSMRGGMNVSVDATGSLHSRSFADRTRGVSVAPLIRIDANGYINLRRANGPAAVSNAIRIELRMKNLLNKRPVIETFDDLGGVTLNPYLLDPVGRTLALSFRLPLSR